MALAAVMAITKWSISSVGPTVLSRRVAAYPLRAGGSAPPVLPTHHTQCTRLDAPRHEDRAVSR